MNHWLTLRLQKKSVPNKTKPGRKYEHTQALKDNEAYTKKGE